MMDVFVASIGGIIFFASCVVMVLLIRYGIESPSYEQAVAEQRQQMDTLWGPQRRSKNKERKLKKIGKKVKEKQLLTSNGKSEPEEEEDEEAESDKQSTETSTASESVKHHVEFQEEPATIEDSPVKENVGKRRLKRHKVRSILVNRDMSEETVVSDEETPLTNHFEQLHPKDEFELLHAHLKEEQAIKQEKIIKPRQIVEASIEPKNKKVSKQTGEAPPPSVVTETKTAEVVVVEPKTSKKIVKQSEEVVVAPPVVVVEKEETVAVTPPTEVSNTAVVKEKKKKKNELGTIHQLTGDKQGVVSLAVLNTLVRKAELSRSEIQILIDVLLNKQHEAPAVLDEWSEGKADPVQKLKKQLAEKEKSLAEEQEALVSAQAKLKEVRVEQAGERSQLQQRARALEETLQAKLVESQSATNHLHSVNQKLQQLQAQLNDEIMKNHKLMDEHAALQMQRQQLEHHLAQTQEAQSTAAQLQNDLQEVQAHNNQLTLTINEQKEQYQATIVQYQHQLGHFTKDMEQKNEIIQRMEEARTGLEHRLSMSHKQEDDLTMETSQLKSNCQQQLEEIRRLELSNNQSLNEVRIFQEHKDGFEKIIFQLKSEVQQLQDEKLQLESALRTGTLEESKTHKIELMNLHNEISSAKTQLQQTEKKHAVDLEATVKKFQAEIEELKNKNNELRKRNWKVMEALKAAESSKSSQSSPNVDVTVAKVRQEEQEIYKNLIQRLFPSVNINDGVPQEQWILQVEKAIQDHVSSLQDARPPEQADNSEVAKLQAQLLNYKSVIDDTEGMLSKLQAHVEQAEVTWKAEIKSKEDEVEALKRQHVQQRAEPPTSEIQGVQFAYECIEKSLPAIVDELQTQLATLETQLKEEQETKQRLTEECHSYKARSKPQADNISQVEKLSEELNRLSEELRVERTKNVELQAEIDDTSAKTQNHNSRNGPSISIEQILSSASSPASSVIEVTVKKNNKKKKKKNNGN